MYTGISVNWLGRGVTWEESELKFDTCRSKVQTWLWGQPEERELSNLLSKYLLSHTKPPRAHELGKVPVVCKEKLD